MSHGDRRSVCGRKFLGRRCWWLHIVWEVNRHVEVSMSLSEKRHVAMGEQWLGRPPNTLTGMRVGFLKCGGKAMVPGASVVAPSSVFSDPGCPLRLRSRLPVGTQVSGAPSGPPCASL